ncbi:MAG: hypothetical protein JKY66_10735 [Spongiibacteraceae bacterium]|nr:hypothetical protein [Spongiibacteraceae bacterium]
MKRIFLLCLILLLASVALVAAIEYDPGYLLLSYGLYTLETSIWVGLSVFIVLFIFIYSIFSLIRRAISGSNKIGQWFSGRGYRKSQRQTSLGLIAYIEGNWQSARRILSRAADRSETPLLNYLIAARACYELGDNKQIKEFLQKAEQSTAGAGIAVELTQAELQLKSGQLEQALATLTRVRHNAGKHPYLLRLLQSVYVGLNDWQAVLALLPELRRHKVDSEENLSALALSASKARMLDIVKIKENSLNELNSFWKKLSKELSHNSELIACFAKQLIRIGSDQQAEKLIRQQIRREWNTQLVALYGTIAGDDVDKQLLHAENWLRERNNDSTLLLTLGRLALRNSLWGKAREYFESSLKLQRSSEVCAELGRLLAHLGEHESSNEYFHKGLLLSTNGLPSLPMPEKRIAQ